MMKPGILLQEEPVPIYFAEKIINTAAVQLYAEAWEYLLRHDLTSPSTFPNWETACIWVPDAGLITYSLLTTEPELWVGITYVRESQRAKPVLQEMWKHIVQKAKANNCTTIGFSTVPHNEPMNALGRRFGKATATVYEIKV